MRDLDGSPRRRARRLAGYVSIVVPAMAMAGALGAGAAQAAPGGQAGAAATSATADAHGNGGVGNGAGNGNDKHDSAVITAQSVVTVADTAAAMQAAADTSSATTEAASTTATSHVTSGTAGTSGDVSQAQPLSTADMNGGGANGQCKGGPYCSTRDGSPSGNGNQKPGTHKGEPCAGCVGKADNKNPQGQKPNGSDHNAGYECDRNKGIGQTNPAHTGCKSPPPTVCNAPNTLVNGVCTPPSTCAAPNTMVNGLCTPPSTCVAPNTMVNGLCTPPSTCDAPSTMVNGVCTPPQGCPEGESLKNGTCQPNPDCVPSDANNQCQPTNPVSCPPDAELSADGTTCVLGEKQTKPPTTVEGEKVVHTPSTLPFTGANVDGLLLAALAGLATGTGLVLVGRRRRA